MALKQGVQFDPEEKKDFEQSWEKSVECARKMISYVGNLKLHDLQETVKLNEVRKILMELARPIAEISQNIQTNINLAKDKKKELENGNFTLDDLKSKLMIDQVDLQPSKLGI